MGAPWMMGVNVTQVAFTFQKVVFLVPNLGSVDLGAYVNFMFFNSAPA